jgi:hypothetical protein
LNPWPKFVVDPITIPFLTTSMMGTTIVSILYIKAIVVSVCLFVCGDKQGKVGAGQTRRIRWVLSVCVGSAWKILPVTACSLWN